ncbi:MAG: hypothetical protein FWF15_09080 [Oscillospiraceae bacterium]|nr:hypothetical protein [Oscillospiraceae bacterium]
MEAVRQIIDSNLLNGVISLPKDFQNKKVEIIIFLKEEKTGLPIFTKNDIDAMLKDSVTESLIGVLPQSDLSLEDYRAERLSKYERTD